MWTLCAKHYCEWLKILTSNVYNPIFQNDEISGPLQKVTLWKLRFEFIIQANVDLWLLHSIAVSWSNASGVKGRKENTGIWSFLFSRVFVGYDSKHILTQLGNPEKSKKNHFYFHSRCTLSLSKHFLCLTSLFPGLKHSHDTIFEVSRLHRAESMKQFKRMGRVSGWDKSACSDIMRKHKCLTILLSSPACSRYKIGWPRKCFKRKMFGWVSGGVLKWNEES